MTTETQFDLFATPSDGSLPAGAPAAGSTKPGLYLLDGMALVYRAFYALQQARMTTKEGTPTGAVFGFVSSLLRIIEAYRPEYLAVAFDSREKTFRHERFEAYKANRPAPPEDLIVQLGDIRELIGAFGIPVIAIPGFEADDIIGSAARRFEAECSVYIVTPDKDMAQLVHDGVRILKPGKRQNDFDLMGVREVEEQFGVPPTQFIDFLTLTGDTSDNVPGARGIGPKTAASLLGKYGSLEGIYAHIGELSPKSRHSLEEFRETMPLIRELVTIRTDLDLPVGLEELHCGNPDTGRLSDILGRLELKSIASRIPAIFGIATLQGSDPETGGTLPGTGEPAVNPELLPASHETEYTLVDSEEKLDRLIGLLEGSEGFAVDTETTSIDTFKAEIVGISFSVRPKEAFFVYFGKQGLDAVSTLKRLKPLLENESKPKTGQNLKYDILVLKNYGIELGPVAFDTMLASYVLNPEEKHNLDDLAAKHLARRTTTFAELVGEGRSAVPILDVEPLRLSDYACQDADIALRLREALQERLEQEPGLLGLCETLEFPLVDILAGMEYRGISIDTAHLEMTAVTVNRDLASLSEKIHAAAGAPFNIDSPKQLANVLFNVLKLPAKKATKTGYSTNVQILEELSLIHPIASDLLEYRTLQKLKTTYIDALPKMVNPRTGRLHTTFNQYVTATGRLSSSSPNLQNIPIRTALGKEIRRAFIPSNRDGLLLSADYSQIELRIAAELSGDAGLIEAFRNREDIHAATARVIFGTEEVSADMRRKAKEVNFGVLYGIQPFGLAQRLGITQKEAKSIIDTYTAKYPGMFASLEKTIAEARKKGYVSTLMGRRRYIADLNSSNGNIRKAAERVAMNTPIQGTAADVIKYAMCSISRRMRQERFSSAMLLQVHDELLFETTEAEKQRLEALVVECMVEAGEACGMRNVPLEVETGTGKNWLEAH